MAERFQLSRYPCGRKQTARSVLGGREFLSDIVVAAFREGASPEHVAEQYPELDLADVYAAIKATTCGTGRRLTPVLLAARHEAEQLRADSRIGGSASSS